MLIISRRIGESIMIGDQRVEVFVRKLKGDTVSLAIKAPPNVAIVRSELVDQTADKPIVRIKRKVPPTTPD